MRTIRDALLSMQKYVDVIFNGDPKLYEIRWSGNRWTGKRWQSKGALLVSDDQWNALRYYAYQEVVEPLQDLLVDAVMRDLYTDPRPAIIALGLPPLPTGVGTVGGSTPPDAQWEVRIAQERGEFIRAEPVALVYLVGPPTNTGSAKYAEWTQAMAVHCYPPPQSTVDLSTLAALDVEIKLQDAFRMRGVGLGRPLRVPLFDYADVLDPMVQDSNVRFPSDFLSITSFDTERLPDAQDGRRIRVVANFQARWRSTGRIEGGRITESVVTKVGTVL